MARRNRIGRVPGLEMAVARRNRIGRVPGLEMAVAQRRPARGVIHHSDHGSQYTALLFTGRCEQPTVYRWLSSGEVTAVSRNSGTRRTREDSRGHDELGD